MSRELARRIAFTIGALLLFRLGTQIPIPGLDLSDVSPTLDLVSRLSIFALGLIPYLILISYASVPFYFGGTSLLIVVSVTMDTVAQVQGYLLAHQYEGLIRKSKLRGRRR
ncbi:preprotein translocase subunit SecY [Bradyrhizobium sp. USDA 372]